MQEFSAPIIQQPRLVLVLPIVFIVVAVVGANLVWFLLRSSGASQSLVGAGAVLVFVAGIGLAIWSSVGNQGTIRVRDGMLEVDGRWRGPRNVPVANAELRPMVWRRGGVTKMLIGVTVDVRGSDGSSVTIGSSDPGLADLLIRDGIGSTTIPPRATLSPADFRRLLETLGMAVPSAGVR